MGKTKRNLSDSTIATVILVFFIGLALALILPARAIPPTETPGLLLDGARISEVVAQDAKDASKAPQSELSDELRELYAAHCRAEQGLGEAPNEIQERRAAMSRALATLRDEGGHEAILALRAEATERLENALDGNVSEAEKQGLLGLFPTQMERYGLSQGGEEVAPRFVTRSLFKARWNAPHGLDPVEGLSETELAAYWGWLALEARVDPVWRLSALDRYEETSGKRLPEARAVLLYLAGQRTAAADIYEQLISESGSRRLRNNLLAVMEP